MSFGPEFNLKRRFFQAAFDQVALELQTTGGNLESFGELIFDVQESPSLQNERAIEFFKSHVIGWDRYNKYLASKQAVSKRDMQHKLQESLHLPLPDLLHMRSINKLRTLYLSVAGTKVKGRRKADVVSALEKLLAEKRLTDKVLSLERRRNAREIKEEHEIKPDTKEMAELFVHRVMMMAYAARTKEDALKFKEHFPWWLFDAVDDDRTPVECRRLDGTVKRYDDPFWLKHEFPCEKLFCRCSILTFSDRGLVRHKTMGSGNRRG